MQLVKCVFIEIGLHPQVFRIVASSEQQVVNDIEINLHNLSPRKVLRKLRKIYFAYYLQTQSLNRRYPIEKNEEDRHFLWTKGIAENS